MQSNGISSKRDIIDMEKIFYTYAYLRSKTSKTAEAGTPYYIGKGHGKRAYAYHRRTPVPKDKSKIIILKENLSEKEAFSHEREMIQFYGRKDLGTGILMNWTDGGEGPSNPSPETRRRMVEGRAAYFKDRPEMLGGSLGRTPEQHSADSARAAQKGIVKWTKDKWENDPEWAAEQRERARQTGLKNAELGIGICGLTKEQRSANTKALFEGEDGEERKEFYRKRAKNWKESGIGMYSEEAQQKARETFYKNGKNFDEFTVVSPWGETISDKGIKPFARKHGIPMESFRSLVKGDTPKIMGWTLPGYDEYQVLNLLREGKTKEEVEKIVGYGITNLSNHFPKPKEGHKYCYCCFEELPLSDFNKDKTRNDGLRERCRKCCMKPEERKRRELKEKGLRECKTCEKVLPISDFYVGKSRCKCCQSIKYKKPEIEKICPHCGTSFIVTNPRYKYCTPICKSRSKPPKVYIKKRPTFPPAKEGHKWCPCCKQELPFSAFWKDKSRKDGCASQCKCCKSK